MKLSAHTYRRLALIACTRALRRNESNSAGSLSLFPLCQFSGIFKDSDIRKVEFILSEKARPNDDELKILDFLLSEYRKCYQSSLEVENAKDENKSLYLPKGFETKSSFSHFGKEMDVIEAIDDIMRCTRLPQWSVRQKIEIVMLFLLKLGSSERELSVELKGELPKFSGILHKVLDEDFGRKNFDIYLDEYVELCHLLNLPPEKETPDASEITRRRRISATKQHQNEERQARWKEHEKKIRELYAQGGTMKAACEMYFRENQEKLKQEGISSVGTLQNKLTGQQHPDRRRKERNEIDATFPIQDPDLTSLLTLIK